MTTEGLSFPKESSLTTAEWTTIGTTLGSLLGERLNRYDFEITPIKWSLGDWLVYGEMSATISYQIEIAASITGVSKKVLEACKIVSAFFVYDDRVNGATWKMHQETIPLELSRAKELLEKCVHQNWEPARWKAAVNLAKEVRAKAVGLDKIIEPSVFKEAADVEKNIQTPQAKKVIPNKGKRGKWLTGVRCPECKHLIKAGPELRAAREFS